MYRNHNFRIGIKQFIDLAVNSTIDENSVKVPESVQMYFDKLIQFSDFWKTIQIFDEIFGKNFFVMDGTVVVCKFRPILAKVLLE